MNGMGLSILILQPPSFPSSSGEVFRPFLLSLAGEDFVVRLRCDLSRTMKVRGKIHPLFQLKNEALGYEKT